MRYVDADKLIAHLKDEMKVCHLPFGSRSGGKGIAYGTILGLKSAISFAETLATADVVSREDLKDLLLKKRLVYPDPLPSDVVREIETRARTAINSIKADVVPKSDVEELIKSIDDMLGLVCAMTGLEFTYFGKYAELKKKYTGENSDG